MVESYKLVGETVSSFTTTTVVPDVFGQSDTAGHDGIIVVGADDTVVVYIDKNVVDDDDDDDGIAGDADDSDTDNTDIVVSDVSR